MKKIFSRFLKRTHSHPGILIGGQTILGDGFHLENRGDPNTIRLHIGEQCVVNCSVIMERNIGQVSIGDRTYIGRGTTIICATNIQIGSDVLMAWGITVMDHDSHSTSWHHRVEDVEQWRLGLLDGGIRSASQRKNWNVVPMSSIIIEDKVWVGFNSTILKGVHVGEGAVIAAGSIVTKDVPAYNIVAGNPAKVVRELREDER